MVIHFKAHGIYQGGNNAEIKGEDPAPYRD